MYCNLLQCLCSGAKNNIQTELGSKGSENGQFKSPHSLAVDRFGNIYVGDTGNKRIEKFYPNGTFVTSSGGEGDGQFDLPTSFAIDSFGFVYVTDINNDRVQKFDNNGKYITKLGGLRGSLNVMKNYSTDRNRIISYI